MARGKLAMVMVVMEVMDVDTMARGKLAMEDIQKRRDAKNQRRSAAGGRRKSKSGAALASLTKGKQGDKASKRDYAKKHDNKAGNKKGKKETVFKKKMGGK